MGVVWFHSLTATGLKLVKETIFTGCLLNIFAISLPRTALASGSTSNFAARYNLRNFVCIPEMLSSNLAKCIKMGGAGLGYK